MPALPVFQRLPLHIANEIVCYCITTELRRGYYSKKYKGEMAVWKTLYDASYSWRLLALQFFFHKIVISISTITGKGQLEFPCNPGEIKLKPIYYNYVKRVRIEFPDFATLPTKKSIHDFSTAWPKDLVFPSARHLYIHLPGLLYQKVDQRSTTEDERFYWITQRIQNSLPQLQNITIADNGIPDRPSRDAIRKGWKAKEFLSAIFDKVASINIRISSVNFISDYSFLQKGTGLAKLEFSCCDRNGLFGRVVERSAPTLELLKVDDLYLNVWSLIFDKKGQPIVYPRLRRFEFDGQGSYISDRNLEVDKSVVPFPALSYLRWNSPYVFKDDALFRGNSGTLEYLDIKVDTDISKSLREHSQLCSVSVGDLDGRNSVTMSRDTLVEFTVSLVSLATKYLSLYLDRDRIDVIAECTTLKNIQVLYLAKALPTITDLLEVIKLFPSLTTLRCPPSKVNTKTDSLQFSEFINDLHTNYYPLSHRFRYWDSMIEYGSIGRYLAPSALVFAILNTNFVSASIFWRYRVDFYRKIQNAIGSEFLNEHRGKIRRLLRIMD